MFKIGREKAAGSLFTFTTQAVRMPKIRFQPRQPRPQGLLLAQNGEKVLGTRLVAARAEI